MSRTELHIGKLREIDLEGRSLEDYCKSKVKETSLPEWADNWFEVLREEGGWEKYFTVKGRLFESFDHTESEDPDIQQLTRNPDGTYSFVMSFYNGGTCLTELIEEELERNLANNP